MSEEARDTEAGEVESHDAEAGVEAPEVEVRAGHERRGPAFWLAFAVGLAGVGWGVRLFADTAGADELFGLGLWIVLADLLADWLAVPLVGLVGWLAARYVVGWAKAPVQVGLILSGSVLLVAALPLSGSAEGARNPTIQPIDYPPAVAVTLGLVWLAVTLWAARRRQVARA